jgi:hypothetical protein
MTIHPQAANLEPQFTLLASARRALQFCVLSFAFLQTGFDLLSIVSPQEVHLDEAT